jgi:small-conductance mechanosensitive channel
MKNFLKTNIVLLTILIFILVPIFISSAAGLNIPNPLGETSDISVLASNIIKFLIILAIPITSILVVYAGYLYITSAGNEEKVKTAQKALIWALVGFAVVLVASSVPAIIQEFLSGEEESSGIEGNGGTGAGAGTGAEGEIDFETEELDDSNDSDISDIGEFPDEFYEDVLTY